MLFSKNQLLLEILSFIDIYFAFDANKSITISIKDYRWNLYKHFRLEVFLSPSALLELNHITSLLINFEPLRCVVYWKTVLKKGGAYFKVIGSYSYQISRLYHCVFQIIVVFVYLVFVYLFRIHVNLVNSC